MDKRWLCLFALVILAGCNRSSQLAVQAVSTSDAGQVGRTQLEIRLIPYDRDSLFETMIAMASTPEPQPPAELLELRDSIAAAQERWRSSEAAWNDARSELQSLSDRMGRMDRTSDEYFAAYQRFDDLDSQEGGLGRDKDRFFDRFTELQSEYTAQADSFAAVLTTWEDEAFASYGEAVDSLLKLIKREDLYDTTDASGFASFTVPNGRWWIYTRFKLPFEELYWNVPYDAAGGAGDTIVLDESNAALRLVF